MEVNFLQKKLVNLVLLFLVSTTLLTAQTGTVSGNASDEDGPLIGATIQLKGATLGTTTDFDGNYSFKVDPGSYTLVASYIGYGSQEVAITVSSNAVTSTNFILSEGVAFDEIVVVGSRAAGRTKLTTAVPVDIVDIKALAGAGAQTNVNQILNYVAPSFSSNTQTISDGTDHIDPASLRGLGPDQVLVLINGKRRHTSSLVNVNGTFGRGNVGTDLNAIPVSSIDRIEVLRDGAAAQYGSDAIAGVINIILREDVNTLTASLTSGAYMSSGSNFQTGGSDGENVDLSLNYGIPLGEKGGFINFSGNYEKRAFTSRMKEFDGQIFSAFNGIERLAQADGVDITELTPGQVRNYAQELDYLTAAEKAQINSMDDDQIHQQSGIILGTDTINNPLTNNVTDAELGIRGLERSDFNMRVGQSALTGGKFMMNMAIPLGGGTELYANAGMGFRAGEAAGFYRLPYQNRTLTSVYPDGFLPEIHSKVADKNFAAGIRGKLGAWDADFSNTYGTNSFRFLIKNTSNASLGKSTPKEFDAGGFSFVQNTTNFDLSRTFDVASGLNFAMGSEVRYENYNINAGKEDSYATYDVPSAEDWFGRSRPGGAQVFPGFKPANELSEFRTSFAAYADAEIDITDKFLLGAAIRFEDYSDFGNTFNYKTVARYRVTDNWSVRAAYNTGFRAPSLHQIYYNSTSTLFVDGVPNEVGTFSNNSRIAGILGIPSLKEETSASISAGVTGRIPSANLTLTVDVYQIAIQDRIVLTGTFAPGNDVELQKLFAQASAEKATFFANAIDTKSNGLDLVVTHHLNLGKGSSLKTSLAGTFSKTKLDGDVKTSEALADKVDTYFDETSRIYLENSVPNTKLNLSFAYKMNKFNAFLRGVYFGEVTNATNTAANQQVYDPKMVLDLSLGYEVTKSLSVTLGANNLLDTYPDRNIEANRSSGRFDYSRRAQQFGFQGRYVFGRVTYTL